MPTFPTPVDTVALTRRLNSSNDAERQQAQADLQALIAADVCRIRQCRNVQVYSFTVAMLLYLAVFVHDRIIGHHPVNDFVVVAVITSTILGYAAQSQAKFAIYNIGALDIPQAVGALLDVYGMNGRFVLGDSRLALIRLLPRLQATDANVLTLVQRKLLYRIISCNERNPWGINYWSAELKIAVLRALEQIGDEKAIPYVEKAARNARNPQVRTAAQECLPFLTLRAERRRVEQTLLRAGTPPTSDTLLRPSVSTAPTEPQQLLRASNMESNDNEP